MNKVPLRALLAAALAALTLAGVSSATGPSEVDQSFITGITFPYALAAGDTHVYWSDPVTGQIGRANLDGTGVEASFITDVFSGGVAVDGAYVYWSDLIGDKIARAKLDGSGLEPSFITGASGPLGVAVDGNYIYWANSTGNTIGRANLDGTGVDQSFITGVSPWGLAAGSAHIYWINAQTTIGRANLDGTGVDYSFITGVGGHYVAVDNAHVYWNGYLTNTIGRASLDGSGVDEAFVTGANVPIGVASDNGHLYWINFLENSIGRATLDSTPPVITFSGDRAYGLLETVNVSCTAVDDLSGVAAHTCGTLASGPAWTFGAGTHAVSATATDGAGNTGSAASSFSVSVTSVELCALTEQFSSKKNENDLCNKLKEAQKAAAKGKLKEKQKKIDEYVEKVQKDVPKAFTASQAATLVALAQSL